MEQMQPANRGSESLSVALDARIPDGRWGGVQQVVQGLAHGLSRLDGPESYMFLVETGRGEWLRPMIGGPCQLLEVPPGFGRSRARRAYDLLSTRLPIATKVAKMVAAPAAGRTRSIATSKGLVESVGADVVHFTTPQAFLTDLPSIYQPHDLLHRHYPGELGALHARYRDDTYRVFSERAAFVAVMTEWGRSDIQEAFGLPARKIAVVPWAPVTGMVPLGASAADLELPDRFVVYPAQTWPHKNHLRLLEAVAILRDEGTVVPLICTGRQTDHMGAIQRRVDQLRLSEQVRFTGYLPASELETIYRRATALVFPSLFEGWGLPVVEAFALGLPVACADVTALPEVAGDAAVLFNPDSPQAIADAIARVWTAADLRATLIELGRRRASQLSWDRTARTFRALYRHVTSRTLDDEDRMLLAAPTLP
jgi:glycosyltransferase involved in cell wall biosynthesis